MSGRTEYLLDNRVPMSVTESTSPNSFEQGVEDIMDMEVLDSNILESGSNNPLVIPEIKVMRFVFGVAFGQFLVIISLGFLIFQLSSKLPIQDKRIATIVTWAITILTLLLLTLVRKTKKAIVFLVLITMELSLLTGFTAILLGNIAPIQFAAILFGQTACLFGYTFVSPRYTDMRYIVAILCVATILVWCIGIFAFNKDNDWASAIFIALAGYGVAVYYMAQIKYVHRYRLDEKLLALAGLFVDPFLVTWYLLKTCHQCSCCKAAPVEPSPFEEDAIAI